MVMLDPWLRGGGNGGIYAPQGQRVYNITVNNFMLPNVKQWNTKKIRQLLTHVVVMEILKVPLLEEVGEIV